MQKSFLCCIFVTLIVSSCTYDNPITLSEPTTPVGLVTYNNNVKTIINNNCISCHSNVPTNGATFSLTNYAEVKNKIVSIKDRISRAEGTGGIMPDNGTRLPQTSIDIIFKWQTDGLIQ